MIRAPTSFPTKEAHLQFPGPVGELEIITHVAKDNPRNIVGVICHPHPLHGGTMHNKVVTTLDRTLRELGLKTVRFNFRGVGKSEGTHAEGIGEAEDLISIVEWIKSVLPEHEIWLAGFSFGSFVSASVAMRYPVAKLISVAPYVERFVAHAIQAPACPWIIVQGCQDEIVDPDTVFSWVKTLSPEPTLIAMEGATHFFHGKLVELRERLKQVLLDA